MCTDKTAVLGIPGTFPFRSSPPCPSSSSAGSFPFGSSPHPASSSSLGSFPFGSCPPPAPPPRLGSFPFGPPPSSPASHPSPTTSAAHPQPPSSSEAPFTPADGLHNALMARVPLYPLPLSAVGPPRRTSCSRRFSWAVAALQVVYISSYRSLIALGIFFVVGANALERARGRKRTSCSKFPISDFNHAKFPFLDSTRVRRQSTHRKALHPRPSPCLSSSR